MNTLSSKKAPIRAAVTGAAGNIGYALPFRIASGAMFAPNQPVALNLIGISPGHEGFGWCGHGAGRLRLPTSNGYRADGRLERGLQGC